MRGARMATEGIDTLAQIIREIAAAPQLQDYVVKKFTVAKIPVPVCDNWLLTQLAAMAISEYSSGTLKLRCIEALLDRGWGKTPDTVHHSHRGSVSARDLTDDQLAQYIIEGSSTAGTGK
jgi:hypothetical protein